jgi:hypothetical protein
MAAMIQAYHGGCHCDALRVTFETALEPGAIQRRACQCSFCRAHGGVTVSDPEGAMRVDAKADALVRYQFGLKVSDFLICARCGVYVGAVFFDGDDAWGVVNVNALHERDAFAAPVQPISYDGENPSSRGERRKTKWTPLHAFNVA